MILGFSGYARSGKDTAAEVLVQNGWERVAFADKLRAMLLAINPIVNKVTDYEPVVKLSDGEAEVVRYNFDEVRLQDVITVFGWEGYKSSRYGAEIRELLQRLGTEGGRQTLWDSIWIDAAFYDLDQDKNYVVTDCRFPNEAGAIKDRGGEVWRIERTGVGPANSHPSETSLDTWDFDGTLLNDGTLEEFHAKVLSKFGI